MIKLSTYLTQYKRGDYVDIKANAAQHKGMPYKNYHGRTGIVFNVTKRAVGVRVNKPVNGRIIEKRVHVRPAAPPSLFLPPSPQPDCLPIAPFCFVV